MERSTGEMDLAGVLEKLKEWDSEGTGKISNGDLASILRSLDPELAERALRNGVLSDGPGDTAYGDFVAGLFPDEAATSGAFELTVQLMSGTVVSLSVAPTDTVDDLKSKVSGLAVAPKNHSLKLFFGNRSLSNKDSVTELRGQQLTAVFGNSETCYLVLDKAGEAVLIDEGDEGYEEKRVQNVDPSKWVPAPEAWPTCTNVSRHSLGVEVRASSNIFGVETSGNQKLLNVLRLGAAYGEPRFSVGDSSFIFAGSDKDPHLIVDLGRVLPLVRIGSMCYSDRWLNSFAVQVSCNEPAGHVQWQEWGAERRSRNNGGMVFFDKPEPTEVRLIRFSAKSGHCPGARLGPVFAYGWPEPVGAAK